MSAGAGLVTCAKTVRDLEWRPRFPSPELVGIAAGQFPELAAWRGEEGPRWQITVSPGALGVGTRDRGKAERTHEREHHHHLTDVEQEAAYFAEHGCWPAGTVAREITEWSRKSRSRMIRRLSELDYGPLLNDQAVMPCMITLTYPGDWLTVAPTGQDSKRHLRAFCKRWQRRWSGRLTGIWKLEFQGRGAPHYHLFTVVPGGDAAVFRAWLSATWAGVVGHPDPEEFRRHLLAGTGVDYQEGLRSRDPRRLAVYFAKHGSYSAKEYQHDVPAQWQEKGCGPGRFWGYWGLKPAIAVVDVAPEVGVQAARVLRRWSAAQGTTRQVFAPRDKNGRVQSAYPEVIGLAGRMLLSSHPVRRRRVRRRVKRMKRGRGWVLLNDAPSVASELARFVSVREPETVADRTARLVAATGRMRDVVVC
jgi:hypothetical protein